MDAPRPFTCEDVFRHLDDYLDRELGPEETRLVQEHLEACAQCASEARFERQVLDDLRRKLQRIRAPETLLEKVRKVVSDGS